LNDLTTLPHDAPIVLAFPPNCGTNRLRPVIGSVLDWLGKSRIQIKPRNQRIAKSLRVSEVVYSDMPYVRRVIDETYFHYLSLMDENQWCSLHDHASAELLSRLSFCRVVALYRDPRDYLVSLYHWFLDPRSQFQCPVFSTLSKEDGMMQLIKGCVVPQEGWAGHFPSLYQLAINFVGLRDHPNILPVSYEEARSPDPRPFYRRVFSWLKLDHPSLKPITEPLLDEAVSLGTFAFQSGGKVQEGTLEAFSTAQTVDNIALRKGIVGDWKNHFTPKVKDRVKELIGPNLIKLGYEKDMEW